MEKTGSADKLLNTIFEATHTLELGRKNFHIKGKEPQGRILFTLGIEELNKTFKEIQATHDPQTIINAEKVFLEQDIRFCDPTDKLTINSLKRSLNYLNDSLRSIEVVKSPEAYKLSEATHCTENRNKRGYVPKDVMHEACNINSSRLDKNNRTPGLPMIEKELIKQRKSNLTTAKEAYIEMQKKALGLPESAKIIA